MSTVPDAIREIECLRASLAKVTAERDRLRDVLDCETGKRGPEGWTWREGAWERGTLRVSRQENGQWQWFDGTFLRQQADGTFTDRGYALSALEAIEAAVRVAGGGA